MPKTRRSASSACPRQFFGNKKNHMPDARGACRAYDWGFGSIFPRSPRPPSMREVWGIRRSRPSALPSIAYRGFAVAPMTLRALARKVVITSEINWRAMRAPTVYGGATDGCKCISQLQFPSPKTSLLEGGGPSADGGRSNPLHLPRMSTFIDPPPLFWWFLSFSAYMRWSARMRISAAAALSSG